MHFRGTPAPARRRAGSGKEGSLTAVTFVGSFPTADFRVIPELPEIAIVGRSNVGKSSLINALVGRKRLARTSETPGKTRMCNVYRVAQAYHLVDLPGYGYARISKRMRAELRALISSYLESRRELAGVVWLLDIRRAPSEDDHAIGALLTRRARPVLVAVTKADKMVRARQPARLATLADAVGVPPDQCVLTSAVTRDGLQTLRESISALVRAAPAVAAPRL